MTTAQHGDPIDQNVKRVLQTALGNRDMTVNELILKSGLKKSTYFRRRNEGGWLLSELIALAAALEVDPNLFLQPADGLVPRAANAEGITPSTRRKPGESLQRRSFPKVA